MAVANDQQLRRALRQPFLERQGGQFRGGIGPHLLFGLDVARPVEGKEEQGAERDIAPLPVLEETIGNALLRRFPDQHPALPALALLPTRPILRRDPAPLPPHSAALMPPPGQSPATGSY